MAHEPPAPCLGRRGAERRDVLRGALSPDLIFSVSHNLRAHGLHDKKRELVSVKWAVGRLTAPWAPTPFPPYIDLGERVGPRVWVVLLRDWGTWYTGYVFILCFDNNRESPVHLPSCKDITILCHKPRAELGYLDLSECEPVHISLYIYMMFSTLLYSQHTHTLECGFQHQRRGWET